MAGRALLLRAEPGFSLPAFERFAPPPPPALVAARIEASSAPGDVVLDPFGRGGWVARAAIDRQRKALSLESTPLDRLLAEIVLRPPDLRHLDAAIQALGAAARRDSSVKASIAESYAARCATCGRPVTLVEVTWAADDDGVDRRPVRIQYRCPVCRDQLRGGELRQAAADDDQVSRADDPGARVARERLRERFPVLDGGDALVDDLLDLHTPRQLAGLAAILERIEADLRAPSIAAALRLALLHALGPASRLATSSGRMSPLRISAGRVRFPNAAGWRERNPWIAFEDGVRLVRGFLQRLESAPALPVSARLGEDLRSLTEGSATTVLRLGTPAAFAALGIEAEHAAATGRRPPRVSLVLGTPPIRPSAERLAWAYHATAWTLGREAASTLPLESLFGPAVRSSWGWQAAALTRSLRALEPVLARDATLVLLLEGDGPESLVAPVVGASTAGYRVTTARLGEAGSDERGVLELVPPGSGAHPGGPRTRANVALPPLPGGAGDPELVAIQRLFAPPPRNPPFSPAEAARVVVDAVVDVLRVRGEPVAFDGLLGEILVGLDRAGHLRRLVHAGEAHDDAAMLAMGPGPPTAIGEPAAPVGSSGAAASAAPPPPPSSEPGDGVDRLLTLVRDALASADGRRLLRVGDDRWWLGDRSDRATAAVPLADRVEWAVYSVLSTGGPLSEPAFLERIAHLFAGTDLPDEALVRACLDSYRSAASTAEALATTDDLVRRSEEHARHIATLVDLGHRLGFECWIGARQQPRRVDGRTLAQRLEPRELAAPPSLGRIRGEDLEEVDVAWYARGRSLFVWEVEWTAMLGETVLKRHARIGPDERLVRFLVVLPERVDLVRHKIARSPLLRSELEAGGWHVLKSNHLATWAARATPTLADLEPLLGLDPEVERAGDQLPLFDA